VQTELAGSPGERHKNGFLGRFAKTTLTPALTVGHTLVRAVLWDNVEGACFRVASSLAGI
jgi:hypothetical protein